MDGMEVDEYRALEKGAESTRGPFSLGFASKTLVSLSGHKRWSRRKSSAIRIDERLRCLLFSVFLCSCRHVHTSTITLVSTHSLTMGFPRRLVLRDHPITGNPSITLIVYRDEKADE